MEKVPRRLASVQANRYVVDHGDYDYLYAYAWHPTSNAQELVKYIVFRENDAKGRIVNNYWY